MKRAPARYCDTGTDTFFSLFFLTADGFGRIHYLINGQYPGPLLLWDEDDWVKVSVVNNCSNPFTMHWHGIWQIGTPQMDGVPGVNQWNIPVGETYVYYFQLKHQHGAYWAHTHTQGFYSDGLRLPIYVRPKKGTSKPWYLISNKTSDIKQMEEAEKHFAINWRTDEWHVTAEEMELNVHATGVPPACMDSLLTNGHGRQFCFNNWTSVAQPVQLLLSQANQDINSHGWSSKGCLSLVKAKPGFDTVSVFDQYYGGKCQNTTAPIAVYNAGAALKAGRKYFNLQVIEATTNWFDGFSIDNHKMWLVAVDGQYIKPRPIDFAQITIGSRLSFMIELDQSKAHRDWPIRFTGVRALQPIEGYALLSYNDTGCDKAELSLVQGFEHLTTRINSSVSFGGQINSTAVQWNQSADEPFNLPWKVPKKSDVTLHAFAAQNSLNVWQISDQPLDTVKADAIQPVLFQLMNNGGDVRKVNTSMLPLSPKIPMGATVDIVIHNPALSIVGKSNSPHPFHLHGHKFWTIKAANGTFAYDSVADAQKAGVSFMLDNPPFRDGFDVVNDGYVVIRYIAGVGPNMLHCHIGACTRPSLLSNATPLATSSTLRLFIMHWFLCTDAFCALHAAPCLCGIVHTPCFDLDGPFHPCNSTSITTTGTDDHLVQGMAAVLLEGLDQIPRGSFAKSYVDKPDNWRNTEDEPVAQELEKSWHTAIKSDLIYTTVNPSNPWGDPRTEGLSAQSLASKVSVSLNSSAVSRLSVASTAKSTKPSATTFINTITNRRTSSHKTKPTKPAARSAVLLGV